MKILKAFCIIVIIFVVSTTSLAQNSSAVDQAKTTVEKALANFNAHNYEGYFTAIAEDFEGYTGIYTPLRFEGKAAWMNFINGLNNYASATYDSRQPDYRNYGDNTVVCNAYFIFSTVTKGGVSEIQSGRETTLLVKINGKWLIANSHYSPMF